MTAINNPGIALNQQKIAKNVNGGISVSGNGKNSTSLKNATTQYVSTASRTQYFSSSAVSNRAYGNSQGVFAQRTLNPAKMKPDYSQLRNSLNAHQGRTTFMGGGYAMPSGSCCSGSGGMNAMNLMQGMMMLNQMAQMTGLGRTGGTSGIATLNNNASTTSPPRTASTLASSGDLSLDAMKNASDSVTLRSAIADAQAATADFDTQIGEYTTIVNDSAKKSAAETAAKEVTTKEGQIESKDKEVGKAKETITTKEKEVESREIGLTQAQERLKEANAEYKGATEDLSTAEKGLTSAKQSLGTAEQQLKTADSMPADAPGKAAAVAAAEAQVATAEAQVTAAEAQVTAAKTRVENAKIAASNASEAEKTAVSELDKAEGLLETSNEALGKAQEQLKTLNTELGKLKEELEVAKEIVKEYEDAKTNLKETQDKKEKYTKEITEQNKRLGKMQEKEAKDLSNIDASVIKTETELAKQQGVDNYDGDTTKEETKANEKTLKLSNQLNADKEEQARLRKLVSSSPGTNTFTTNDGLQAKQIGKHYIIGDKFVDKTEYEKAQTQAQAQPNLNDSNNFRPEGLYGPKPDDPMLA